MSAVLSRLRVAPATVPTPPAARPRGLASARRCAAIAVLAACLLLWHLGVDAATWTSASSRSPTCRRRPRSWRRRWRSAAVAQSSWRISASSLRRVAIGLRHRGRASASRSGLLIGRSRWARDSLLPPLEVLRPIPAVAWIPLAILMFPSSESCDDLHHLHRRAVPDPAQHGPRRRARRSAPRRVGAQPGRARRRSCSRGRSCRAPRPASSPGWHRHGHVVVLPRHRRDDLRASSASATTPGSPTRCRATPTSSSACC